MRSLDRTLVTSTGIPRFHQGLVLRATTNRSDGSQRCTLSIDGSPAPRAVHTLVLEAFVGPKPPKTVIRHRNNDPADCHLENLFYQPTIQRPEDRILRPDRNKSQCSRGHELVAPNLLMSQRSDTRVCRACAQARAARTQARRTGRPELAMDETANQKYAKIMQSGTEVS